MTWSAATIQAIITISVMVGVGIAVLGQVRWRAVQEWESLADARGLRVDALEKELAALRVSHNNEIELLTVRIQAMEAQVAEVQRLNIDLQRELSRSRGARDGKDGKDGRDG